MIDRTIDINRSSMANHVLRKLAINRNPFICETGPRSPWNFFYGWLLMLEEYCECFRTQTFHFRNKKQKCNPDLIFFFFFFFYLKAPVCKFALSKTAYGKGIGGSAWNCLAHHEYRLLIYWLCISKCVIYMPPSISLWKEKVWLSFKAEVLKCMHMHLIWCNRKGALWKNDLMLA